MKVGVLGVGRPWPRRARLPRSVPGVSDAIVIAAGPDDRGAAVATRSLPEHRPVRLDEIAAARTAHAVAVR